MTKQQVLDLYFLDARHKLIEVAAFLDRVDSAAGRDDFRLKAFFAALGELKGGKEKARRACSPSVIPRPNPSPWRKAKARWEPGLASVADPVSSNSNQAHALHRASCPHGQPRHG